jgi:hypothetical protein
MDFFTRLYSLSKLLHAQNLPEAFETHLGRYSVFVDSGPRGQACKYARLTARLWSIEDLPGLPPALAAESKTLREIYESQNSK